MSSSRSRRTGHKSGSSSTSGSQSARQIIESLLTHRINTLTELCRVERLVANAETEEDQLAFQEPMTSAWIYYVESNQMLSELRGLTPNYAFSGEMLTYAQGLVRNDPQSNRSWNFAWMVLEKITEENLVATYAEIEAARPEMWGDVVPDDQQIQELAAYFSQEWTYAINWMLQHWTAAPVWY
ncbi:hypothetical protein QC763_611070 [Podospora pseudopauciseta]|uniref:Uncharacterized protein n=2 Tax=Podospora TaxID=5144 RepID=A0ABR0H6R1_9PEZI|nr:hypothetical protein QC763_611070 [Podospora pseudopauciseta]KAK4672051.1 hypothetical protein QC764_611070 [Podospora pseudoanserina]